MKRFVLAGVAVGTMLLGGTGAANAQWQLSYRQPLPPGAYAWLYGNDCGFVTVREYRFGRVILRQLPRC